MLVLTRKLNEQIQIGNDITITVVRVKGNTVRVGIDAPRDVRIVRAELPVEGEGELNTQAAERDGAPGQPGPVAPPAADSPEDEQARDARSTSTSQPTPASQRRGPLNEVMQDKAAKQAATKKTPFAQMKAQHGHATSDAAIASLRLKPRRRVPGEKPAVLPRLPRLGPASPYTNRLAAYDQVAVLIE